MILHHDTVSPFHNMFVYLDVSKNRGTPKWMVYMENSVKMDDLGVPPFSETPICLFVYYLVKL